jgi:RNase P subunit RPR2
MEKQLKITCPACQNNLAPRVDDIDRAVKAETFAVVCNSCGMRSRFSVSAAHNEEDAVATYSATSLGLEDFDVTEQAFEEYIKWIMRVGKERRRQPDFSQADFLAGAMTAFFAANMANKIPALWVLGPMQGMDVFAHEG